MAMLNRKRMATLAVGVVLAAALNIVSLVAALFGFAGAGYDLWDPANDVLIDSVCIAVAVGITALVTGMFAMASRDTSSACESGGRERRLSRRSSTAA